MPLTAHRIGTYATGSPEWHAARAGKMSGSRIAAACGISPYESRFSLWHRMAGYVGEQEQTEPMYWGTVMEPVIINRFAAEHPELSVRRKPGTWLSNAEPWQLANPDALLAPGPGRRVTEVLEVKTARYSDGWGTPGTDEIPVHYLCQVLWYLMVLGLPRCRVAALFTGSDYQEYVVDADPAAGQELRDIARQFLDTVERDEAPPLDGHSATLQVLKELHPDIDGTTVDIPDSIAIPLVQAKSRLVVPTHRFNEAKAALVDYMGSAKVAYWRAEKIADRRAKTPTSTPYIQLVSNLSMPTTVPTIPREQVAV